MGRSAESELFGEHWQWQLGEEAANLGCLCFLCSEFCFLLLKRAFLCVCVGRGEGSER